MRKHNAGSENPLPTDDYVFKLIFGDRRHLDILAAFLKAVLDLPEAEYDHLVIVDPILKRFWKKGKSGILDILVHTTSKRIIHVEIQVEPFKPMRQRILFYASKLIWDQLRWGENYDTLKQTVSIVICDHILLPEEKDYLSRYELRNRTGGIFTDMLEIIILELPKLPPETDGSLLAA
jgi:predicted transposase/invertase (TIGR01784 family)